jgi:hypothetical protein
MAGTTSRVPGTPRTIPDERVQRPGQITTCHFERRDGQDRRSARGGVEIFGSSGWFRRQPVSSQTGFKANVVEAQYCACQIFLRQQLRGR